MSLIFLLHLLALVQLLFIYCSELSIQILSVYLFIRKGKHWIVLKIKGNICEWNLDLALCAGIKKWKQDLISLIFDRENPLTDSDASHKCPPETLLLSLSKKGIEKTVIDAQSMFGDVTINVLLCYAGERSDVIWDCNLYQSAVILPGLYACPFCQGGVKRYQLLDSRGQKDNLLCFSLSYNVNFWAAPPVKPAFTRLCQQIPFL